MLFDKGVHIAVIDRNIPFIERVIDAHFHVGFTHRCREIAQQIPARSGLHRVPGPTPGAVSLLVLPQGIALMMLGGQHDIFGAGAFKHICPLIRIEQLGFEERNKIRVLKSRAIIVRMKIDILLLPLHQAVPVPFRILTDFGERRHRVDAPMNKDAELGVEPPLRCGPFIQ